MRTRPKIAPLVILFLLITVCGISHKHWQRVEKMVQRRDYAAAEHYVEKKKRSAYGKNNRLLYYLDKGILAHHAGHYRESIKAFDQAEITFEDLYTKSASREVAAFITSDNTLPYEGEDFERALMHVYQALNFIYLGDMENALVEGRKVDHLLQLLADTYAAENQKSRTQHEPVKVVYTEDAFVNYLMGILFESQGELNDAFIFYRKAYEAYQMYNRYYKTPLPPDLPKDLLRITDALAFHEEHARYAQTFGSIKWLTYKERRQTGEIIVLFNNGFAPYKVENAITIPHPLERTELFRVAVPKLKRRSFTYQNATVIAATTTTYSDITHLAEDITAIAMRNHSDRYPRIIARTVARILAKETAKAYTRSKAKQSTLGLLLHIGTSVATLVTEQADLRGFVLLPGEIQMARLRVPPDTYTIRVQLNTSTNTAIGIRNLGTVTIQAGETRFLSFRG